jgi:hypothetical protein
MSTDLPFWSDDFDMDLPKVIPDAKLQLGDLADLELVTYSGTTFRRLNHPACWNHELGSVSFFGRPGRRFIEPFYSHGGREQVRCTLWEAVRDAWSHHLVIVFEFAPVLDTGALTRRFDRLMYRLRGWQDDITDTEIEAHKAAVVAAIRDCEMRVRRRIEVVEPGRSIA